MFFYGDPNNPDLSKKVADALYTNLYYPEVTVFPDGEKRIRILEKVVDKKIVVLKSLCPPVDENIMQLAFILDGLKRSGATELSLIVPYFGYSRGDHVFRDGEAVPTEVVVKIIEASRVDKIAFFDPHSIKLPEMFKIPATPLSALSVFAEKIKEIEPAPKKITLVTPDMGGIRRILQLSELLGGVNTATITKERDLHTGNIEISSSEGEFRGTCFIIDDMISTGGTIVQAAAYLFEKDIKKIYLMATHAVFSADATTKLENSKAEKVFVTDSIPVPKEKQFEKLEVLTIAEEITKYLKD